MKCTVSASNNAPGWVASGRRVKSCGRFPGERFFRIPRRSRVRFTEESETRIPCRMTVWCTTSAQRPRPCRSRMMASTVSSASARGEPWGREDRVGIGCSPMRDAFFTHLEIVPGCTPNRRAATRTPYRRANVAASRRTRGSERCVLYIRIVLHAGCFQGIEPLREIDKQYKH